VYDLYKSDKQNNKNFFNINDIIYKIYTHVRVDIRRVVFYAEDKLDGIKGQYGTILAL